MKDRALLISLGIMLLVVGNRAYDLELSSIKHWGGALFLAIGAALIARYFELWRKDE